MNASVGMTNGQAPRQSASGARGRPFEKGRSGNPAGKPRGARNRATLAAEALLDGESEALTRKAIELALAGDAMALRLCIDRILPRCRERPIEFRLPRLRASGDALAAIAAIVAGVARGDLADSEARTLTALVDCFSRTLMAADVEARLAAIEQALSQQALSKKAG